MQRVSKVQEVLARWDRGELSHGDVLFEMVEGLTRENIAEVVGSLPPDWRAQLIEDFRERATTESREQLVVLNAGSFEWEKEPNPRERERMRAEYDRERAQALARYWEIVLPAIRWWLEVYGDTEQRT